MKRPRGGSAPGARSIDGACFLAWRDAPAAGASDDAEPLLRVGELHFSNASHVPEATPLEELYGVLFELRATPQGTWTHDGGDPWRVVPMAATVAAQLAPAPGGGGVAFTLVNEEDARDRLESLAEPAERTYVHPDAPTAAAVVGASGGAACAWRVCVFAFAAHALTRRTHDARSGPGRVAGVRREAQRCGSRRGRSRMRPRVCALSLTAVPTAFPGAGWDLSRIPAEDRTSVEARACAHSCPRF
jgi:hypothetical protein